jgi:hypothetical protein
MSHLLSDEWVNFHGLKHRCKKRQTPQGASQFIPQFSSKTRLLFSVRTTIEAETVGLLNQKFFGRRVEAMVSSPRPISRVFSKNFLRQQHDGTTQASGWSVALSIAQPIHKLKVNGMKCYKFNSNLRNKYAG